MASPRSFTVSRPSTASECGRASIEKIAALLVVLCVIAGCKTSAQTGALGGAGIGALAGQAIGGSTEATLIGAAVGAGVGYIIGNEGDKKRAAELSRNSSGEAIHNDVGSLGGTRWKVVSLNPRDVAPPFASKVILFRPDGRVLTTTTSANGDVVTFDESYRVVGDTLIINKPGYLVNARYRVTGTQMVVSADRFSAVLERIGM